MDIGLTRENKENKPRKINKCMETYIQGQITSGLEVNGMKFSDSSFCLDEEDLSTRRTLNK